MLAVPLILTLYVVEGLGRSYAFAGLVAATEMIGVAIGSPWRGTAIDRFGVRRAVIPSLIAAVTMYPFVTLVGYWGLLPLAFILGLLLLPVHTIVRLSLAVRVRPEQRRTAFAMDGIVSEASFIIGPALGALLVVRASPQIALICVGACIAIASAIFIALDPTVRSEPDPLAVDDAPTGSWRSAHVLFLFAVSAAAMFVLMSTDLSIIAAMREAEAVASIGVLYAAWGGGSLLGGLYYGARTHSIRPSYLLLMLGLLTAPIGLGSSVWVLTLAVIPAGFLCAPTLTAATEWISNLVQEAQRGKAMGWQGTAYTVGGASAAPIAGICIDHFGAAGGFAAGGFVAIAVALAVLGGQVVLNSAREARQEPAGPAASR